MASEDDLKKSVQASPTVLEMFPRGTESRLRSLPRGLCATLTLRDSAEICMSGQERAYLPPPLPRLLPMGVISDREGDSGGSSLCAASRQQTSKQTWI